MAGRDGPDAPRGGAAPGCPDAVDHTTRQRVDDAVAMTGTVAASRAIVARGRVRRPATRVPAAMVVLALGTALSGMPALATTYRCEVDGRVLYSDAPCPAGRQSTVAADDPVDPAERAAAAARLRRDQATLGEIEHQHARERAQDLQAAALDRRRKTDRGNHLDACAKLARRARNAHDAYDLAGPRDQAKDRLKMRRADEDFAALCRR